MAEPDDDVEHVAPALLRRQVANWRSFVIVLAVGLAAQFSIDLVDELRDERENDKSANARAEVQEVLEVVRRQTSPEAQARQRDQIEAIIVTIDCNTRVAFQEALDTLAAQGVLQPGAVTVVENCPP